jgi:cyclophilin family peptidyl-prolyl cis-trans isomerase
LLVLAALGCGSSEAPAKNPVVAMETSMGTIKIELYQDKAPATVKNFLDYVDKKYYDGLVFHRVIKDFMIQGGGFEQGVENTKSVEEFASKEKKTGAPIKNESANGVSNERGTIAMARTNDPDSATAQFFINTVDNKGLDGRPGRAGYAVFGKVTEGLDVVDKIRNVQTKTVVPGIFEDVPVEPVVIKSVRRVEN